MVRTVIALSATLATLAFAAPAHALSASTQSPGNVTDTSATLRGQVDAELVGGSYYFEYGHTQAYGKQTPSVSFGSVLAVKVTLVGLSPSTAYHYRVVASSLLSTARGGDRSFTTLAPPDNSGNDNSGSNSSGSDSSGSSGSSSGSGSGSSGSDSGSGSGSSGSDSSGSGSSGSGDGGSGDSSGTGSGDGNSGSDQLAVVVEPDDSDNPVLGSTVGAAPLSGTIEVKAPGAEEFTPLPDGAPIPVGSTLDARNGSVNLVTALDDAGAVQTATFEGAVFQVRQSRKGKGLTDIYLRGGDFSSCRAARRPPAGTHLLAKKKKKRRRAIRRLWGHDHNGRFRTHGRGAIATVRGTTWVVADHCDGTRTSVLRGAVSVRDKRLHKTVLVHAGHSYFARTHR